MENRPRPRLAQEYVGLSVPSREPRSILYVGKATAKDWYKDDFCSQPAHSNANDRRKERYECTERFLKDRAPHYNSGFWNFAKALDFAAAKKWRSKGKLPLRHITWTNVCKIGTLQRNPEGYLFEKQHSLAVKTLRLEIELYKPALICFVTWDYHFDLVKEVIGDPSDRSWDQTANEKWVWWRTAGDKYPAMLLTGHPERKAQNCVREWVDRASLLLPG
jgi:hypothetical protein